jgi:hypothetical protein
MLVVAIIAYALLDSYYKGDGIIGQTLVDSEFPPTSVSPFYLKPITWLMILIIISWYFFLELVKNRLTLLSSKSASLFSVAFLIITILSFYEVLYNFMIWAVLLVSAGSSAFDPDKVVNAFPSDKYKVNLVVATKIGVTIFGSAVYGFYVLREARKGNHIDKK